MFDKKDSETKKSPSETQFNFSKPSPDKSIPTKTVFIGQSIHIKGELTGNEDLTIEGKVEGNIELKDHNLIIGANGRIEAELFAKNITIMGEVNGNVYAEERVEVTKSGKLRGNIIAPRVVIEDGARFKGSVEMEGNKKFVREDSRRKNGKEKVDVSQESVSVGNVKVPAH